MRRISAHRVFTPDGFLERAVVTVADDGTIVSVDVPAALDGEAGVEFFSGTLVPGLVNAHCHLELSHLRGVIPSGIGFAGFVEAMKRAARVDGTRAADFWDAKMYSEGVQAVADICNGGSTLGLKRQSKIFYHSFIEIFGAAADSAAAEKVRDEALAMGLSASVTPHSLYSLTPDMFARTMGYGVISVHFMESSFEVSDPAAELVGRVPRDRDIMLVHCCLATQRDVDIVMGHFTGRVTWVLCPRSNRYISGIAPPVDLLRRNNLNIATGTDSLASNETLSMGAEMGEFSDVPLEEVLTWATLNGARALGLDGELGSIEVGKRPGLAILSGGEIKRIF